MTTPPRVTNSIVLDSGMMLNSLQEIDELNDVVKVLARIVDSVSLHWLTSHLF